MQCSAVQSSTGRRWLFLFIDLRLDFDKDLDSAAAAEPFILLCPLFVPYSMLRVGRAHIHSAAAAVAAAANRVAADINLKLLFLSNKLTRWNKSVEEEEEEAKMYIVSID